VEEEVSSGNEGGGGGGCHDQPCGEHGTSIIILYLNNFV